MLPPIDPFDISGGQARRNYIRHSISDFTWSNFSGSQILASLQDAGIGISTTDFFNIRRDRLGDIASRENILDLGGDTLIPVSDMIEKPGVQLSQLLQYRFAIQTIDPNTGETDTIYRSLATNDHWSKNEAIDMADNMFAAEGSIYDHNVTGISVEEVWRQPGAIPLR